MFERGSSKLRVEDPYVDKGKNVRIRTAVAARASTSDPFAPATDGGGVRPGNLTASPDACRRTVSGNPQQHELSIRSIAVGGVL